MDYGLQDKVVVITGANGGIGEGLCKAFLEEGAVVVGLCRGSVEKLAPLAEWAMQRGLKFKPTMIDICRSAEVTAGFEEIARKYSRIDVLINNAGATVEKPFVSLTDEEMEEVIDSNLRNTMLTCRSALKIMLIQKAGNIINISSAVGQAHGRGVAAYAASKAAVTRLAECLALEVGKKNIRVNTISPGVIETRLSSALITRHSEVLREITPLRRHGIPADVAHGALFLASDKLSSYVTGHNLVIDGGVSV